MRIQQLLDGKNDGAPSLETESGARLVISTKAS